MAGSANPYRQIQYSPSNIGNKSFYNKVLRDLSSWNWGMKYDDMILKNSSATGINEDPNILATSGSMYDIFSRRAVSKVLEKKSVAFLNFAYTEKQKILRQYSVKGEISEYITIVCDDAIDYDDGSKFCFPVDLKENVAKKVKDRYYQIFEQVYNTLGFNDGITAWNYFRQFIVDGYLAFEIVYDDRQKVIIDIKMLDPATLVPAVEPMSGKKVWIQHPNDIQNRKIMLDSSIIYLAYSGNNSIGIFETSYVENLIRPYNQLKLIEQSRIMFNIMNATMYQKFIIPVGGLSKTRAEEEIGQLIADYKDEVSFNDEMGTVSINGAAHIPFSKQWWFPESESGTPNVEMIKPETADLNEESMLNWFMGALKRSSKVPASRLDGSTGGGNIFSDASEVTRDEMRFTNFISRLRAMFKEIIVKPLIIQTLLEFPELKNDASFINSINVRFNQNNMFEEWKEIGILEKRANILANLLTNIPKEAPDAYFDIDYLIKRILKLTDIEIEENKKAKMRKLGQVPAEEIAPVEAAAEEVPTEEPAAEAPTEEVQPEQPEQPAS